MVIERKRKKIFFSRLKWEQLGLEAIRFSFDQLCEQRLDEQNFQISSKGLRLQMLEEKADLRVVQPKVQNEKWH